jgi:hypothetical protein
MRSDYVDAFYKKNNVTLDFRISSYTHKDTTYAKIPSISVDKFVEYWKTEVYDRVLLLEYEKSFVCASIDKKEFVKESPRIITVDYTINVSTCEKQATIIENSVKFVDNDLYLITPLKQMEPAESKKSNPKSPTPLEGSIQPDELSERLKLLTDPSKSQVKPLIVNKVPNESPEELNERLKPTLPVRKSQTNTPMVILTPSIEFTKEPIQITPQIEATITSNLGSIPLKTETNLFEVVDDNDTNKLFE